MDEINKLLVRPGDRVVKKAPAKIKSQYGTVIEVLPNNFIKWRRDRVKYKTRIDSVFRSDIIILRMKTTHNCFELPKELRK